ncbi:alcohol dehydrogenase, zinc-containing, partial [Streptomyces sp. SPB074]
MIGVPYDEYTEQYIQEVGGAMAAARTMRAVRITGHGGPEVMRLDEVPVPVPGAGEVLVAVRAVALNNTDLWTREGAYGTPGDPEALSGWRGPLDFPRVQGADVAGRVAAVGAGVDAALLGRRVVVDPALYDGDGPDAHPVGLMGSERDGGYAEYVTAPAGQVHDVTDSPLDDAQLASLPTAYGTALGMIERAGLAGGGTVLVTGASGGVGLAAVQLARARGARVVALSSGTKLAAVREAGADAVVDRAGDVPALLREAAPEGFDVVLDVVAGALLGDGLPLLREGGCWVVAGALAGWAVRLDVRRLYLHNARVIGSAMHTRTHFALLMDLARAGAVRPVIAASY